MTNIDYPLALRTFLLSGNNRSQAASFMVTESRSGKSYFKRIAQNQNTYMNISFKFNQNEALLFQSWFQNTLKMGFLPFNIVLDTEWGKVQYECRFLAESLLVATKESPLWSYTAAILIYNYGPPTYLPSDIDQYPQYLKSSAREWLDIITAEFHKVA